MNSEDHYDIDAIRADFPILHQEVSPGVPLVYLDSAATSQKPSAVIEAVDDYYRKHNANVHRAMHKLSAEATESYEGARSLVARFINAESNEIVFTRNATEAVNLVAHAWAETFLQPGDAIVLSEMEHHANLVPWQLLVGRKPGIELRYIPVTDDGLLDLSGLDALLDGAKLVSISHMSNVLGTINPVEDIIARAHDAGARVLLDGAQSVPHMAVDVKALGVDFLVFSGHKMCAPTGSGALYAPLALLEEMPPFLGGGDMIANVTLEGSAWNDPPWKFEAGTPGIAEAVGLGAAVKYLSAIGMDKIHAHERAVVGYALERLAEVPGVKVYGPDIEHKAAAAAFTMEGFHVHDLAQMLNEWGVAVRSGHHCAQPLHTRYGIQGTARASFYLYNTYAEVDTFIKALYEIKTLFA